MNAKVQLISLLKQSSKDTLKIVCWHSPVDDSCAGDVFVIGDVFVFGDVGILGVTTSSPS